MRGTTAVAVLALAAGAAAAVWVAERWKPPGEPAPPAWRQLANGLRFRVQRVEGAKDVAVVTEFAIGSDHDPAGKAGLAHLTEHLYVTAAAGQRPAWTAEQWGANYGGNCFAATFATTTRLGCVFGPERLEAELAEVAARMSDLRIEASDLDRERPRVLEQVSERETDASPLFSARQLASARVHLAPNGGHSGGIPAEIGRLSLDDVRAWSARFYRPVNARVVVAGAIDPEDVTALVTRLFAGLPAGEPAPELARIGPEGETIRVDRGDPPGPGYEPDRAVCVAYPREAWTRADDAACAALGFWKRPDRPSPGRLMFLPQDRTLIVAWTGDDRPLDEVTAASDAILEDFALHGPRGDEAGQMRDALRQAEESIRELKKALPDQKFPSFSTDERPRSLSAAIALLRDDGGPSTSYGIYAALDRLTHEDVSRFVAKWHVAKRRVVVDWRGWTKTYTDDEPKPETHRTPAAHEPIAEVRVTMTWDEATQTVHRRIGERECAKDDELEKEITAAHAKLAGEGKPDAPVTIDADSSIPWRDVMTVVNLVKRCGIEKIEFAMGAPPKRDAPK